MKGHSNGNRGLRRSPLAKNLLPFPPLHMPHSLLQRLWVKPGGPSSSVARAPSRSISSLQTLQLMPALSATCPEAAGVCRESSPLSCTPCSGHAHMLQALGMPWVCHSYPLTKARAWWKQQQEWGELSWSHRLTGIALPWGTGEEISIPGGYETPCPPPTARAFPKPEAPSWAEGQSRLEHCSAGQLSLELSGGVQTGADALCLLQRCAILSQELH